MYDYKEAPLMKLFPHRNQNERSSTPLLLKEVIRKSWRRL
jgi:hypothetical protein